MLLMGIGLVGGAAGTVLVAQFRSIDQQVGTNGSAAAAVLGIGLIVAAVNPSSSIAWVRAGILYGLVVLAFEIISQINGKGFHLGPVIFGLAFTLLFIATYPQPRKPRPEPPVQADKPAPEPLPSPEVEEPERAG